MNERSSQEQDLFEAARKLTQPPQRSAFLDAACAGDAALRKRLEDLLGAQAAADDFFRPLPSPPRVVAAAPSAPEPAPDEHLGTMIGRYKLLQKIGEGGMGVVYMAEQEQPVHRKVALKIIKLGMDTRQVIARFEAERQALAMMAHPHIAKVLDGGATDSPVSDVEGRARHSVRAESGDREGGAQGTDAPYQSQTATGQSHISAGRPYFVMELVQGVPITEFCNAN